MASKARQAEVFHPSAGRTHGARLVLAIVVLLAAVAVVASFFADFIDRGAPDARAGVVSFAGRGPLTTPVELDGTWRVVWRTAPAPDESLFLRVPGPWKGAKVAGKPLPEGGAASYFLRIRDLPPGRYMLFVPKVYAASRVSVNGRVLSERGTFGQTPRTSRYFSRSQEILLETDGSDLNLQIDVSTFHHQENGLLEPPVLGLMDPMSHWLLLDWMRSLILATAVLLVACLGMLVFVFRQDDRASLYMGLACALLLPLVASMSHDNLLLIIMPGLGFGAMMIMQYLASAAALSITLAYTHELFPRESRRVPYLAFQALNGVRFAIYVAIGLTGDIVLLSHYSQGAVLFRTVALVYVLGVAAVAGWRRRDGAVTFLFGLGALVASFVYTDLVANAGFPRLFGLNILPVGMLLLLFSQLVILAERWGVAIRTEAQSNSDLRRLLDVNIAITSEMRLEALLAKMVEVTSQVIHADRTTLFLYDDKSGELWSVVAEGIAERQIRFPSGEGLAGWVFTRGEAVNLSDAYDDERFNRGVDLETGYRTQSVLTVPVTARDGRRLGVMQALNRQVGSRFEASDLQRMNAFAAQAAVAIDNATLFSEVASERNYNESILASMSSGVLTLDRDARLAKVNPAAARILEVQPEQLAGADARAWLELTNPAMLVEIEEVIADGRPKTLLDVDVRTARDNVISANLSMVPLISGGEPVGLLVLIEDITEGKRVQGAMRRFMTPKIVDQVMARNDDLLFGTACRASVLFADIRNFTAMAEALPPRETVDMLNGIFTELFEAVAANDGVLDKFQGDAIMAVYGAPISSGQDPRNAVESAVAMTRMVRGLKDHSGAPIGLGVSIATGEVIAGTIGSPKRMDYTVIGDCVNLASRMQQVSKLYRVGVVVCETTAAAVASAFRLRELDIIRVRGRQQSSKIFQVLTDPPTPAFAAYQRGRDALSQRRWRQAVAAFEAAVAADRGDRPSALMLDRARALARKPPPADWDGVWDPGEAL